MLFDTQSIIKHSVAYGLACCLIREIKHSVAYGLARRCLWVGMLFDSQNIAIFVACWSSIRCLLN